MNKILIIDDDRELCALIKRSVQAENIEADFCNTGKEGLQKLREQEYQLVVLDVMMPGMDGFETLEEIRKEYSLPILMFTSKNDSMSRYEYGVLSLMAQHPGKLFTKEQIFEAVWHKDSESYLRAVTSTIGRIRQKIEDDKDHPRYIKTVSNIGYQFVPSSELVRSNRNL